MSICKTCGKEFHPAHGSKHGTKFCSRTCYQKSWYMRKTAGSRKVCKVCGKEFHPDAKNKTYCSESCRNSGMRLSRRGYKVLDYNKPGHVAALVDRTCDFCGKTFTPKNAKQHYCCMACAKTADNRMRVAIRKASIPVLTKTCAWCGKTFQTIRTRKNTCCNDCRTNRNNHGCSLAEYEQKKAARREQAVARAAAKIAKVRVNGLTEADMRAVIDAQDGDPSNLWKLSHGWTTAQRKFAKARYESKHGLFANIFRG